MDLWEDDLFDDDFSDEEEELEDLPEDETLDLAEDGFADWEDASDGAPEEAPARAELYRPQLTAYSQALSRVLETPVAEMVLYFFAPGCQVTL